MNKKSSNWYVPPDIAHLFFIQFAFPIVALLLFPLLIRFKTGDLLGVFYLALSLGTVGTVLLFFARWPLYRKRQFLTFGPGQLSGVHRKLYWLAYVFVAVSVLLFILIA